MVGNWEVYRRTYTEGTKITSTQREQRNTWDTWN